jgi:hypothetical protein
MNQAVSVPLVTNEKLGMVSGVYGSLSQTSNTSFVAFFERKSRSLLRIFGSRFQMEFPAGVLVRASMVSDDDDADVG